MIVIIKGSDPRFLVTLKTQDNCNVIKTLALLNTMTFKLVYKDLTGLKEKLITTGIAIHDAAYGELAISFTDVETELMKVGVLDFDVHVLEGTTNLIWQFTGEVTVRDRKR
jgi:hypothetical protein